MGKKKRKPFSDGKSRGPLLAGAALNSVYSKSNLTKPYLASQILSNHLASIAQSVIIFLECSMTLCWVMALNALKCFLKLNVRKINSIKMKHDINLIWKQLRPKLKQSTIIWNISNSPGSDWSFEPLKSRLSNFYIFIGIGISSQYTSAVYLNYRFPSKSGRKAHYSTCCLFMHCWDHGAI